MVISDEIQMIQDRIVDAVPVEKLYLFGSYANGTVERRSKQQTLEYTIANERVLLYEKPRSA